MKSDFERFAPILVGLFPIFKRLLPILIRLFPVFERFVPILVSYFLERTFKALKTKGAINDYRTRTVRTGKSHYRIDIRLVLTAEQAKFILNDLLNFLTK
jgi:hypothetical protein